jgi:hypothetical protein
MKRSLKSLKIFQKASHSHHFKKASILLKMCLKSLKIVQNASHYWKSLITLKKASITLKMPSKRIEICTKASIFLEIILKASDSSKNPQITLKKPQFH